MLDIKQFSSDLIDSYLDILTLDEMLLVFKEIKIIFTRYDFDLLFPVGLGISLGPSRNQLSGRAPSVIVWLHTAQQSNFYKLRGYTSCFVVAAAVVACLIVLYLIKQFENMPLQLSRAATRAFFLVFCHCSRATAATTCMHFGILPLPTGKLISTLAQVDPNDII
jgi:hypothetical protein